MTDSGCKDSGELVYEAPELEIHTLSAIVMAGATGGGDSGFTGFADGQPFSYDDEDGSDEEHDDPLRNDW